MNNEKEIRDALYWARAVREHIDAYYFVGSPETDKASRILRGVLSSVGDTQYSNRLATVAIRYDRQLQDSIDELRRIGEAVLADQVAEAQKELRKLFTEEDAKRYWGLERDDDGAWATIV